MKTILIADDERKPEDADLDNLAGPGLRGSSAQQPQHRGYRHPHADRQGSGKDRQRGLALGIGARRKQEYP